MKPWLVAALIVLTPAGARPGGGCGRKRRRASPPRPSLEAGLIVGARRRGRRSRFVGHRLPRVVSGAAHRMPAIPRRPHARNA